MQRQVADRAMLSVTTLEERVRVMEAAVAEADGRTDQPEQVILCLERDKVRLQKPISDIAKTLEFRRYPLDY